MSVGYSYAIINQNFTIMKTEKTLKEEANEAFRKLKKNKDFVVFMTQVFVEGVTMNHIDENGNETPGITIGIIDK
jgi:hypothetical protein